MPNIPYPYLRVEICCLSLIRNLWVRPKKKKSKTIRHSSNMSEQLQENMSTQGLEESNLIRAHPRKDALHPTLSIKGEVQVWGTTTEFNNCI